MRLGGNKVNIPSILGRPGWECIEAVKHRRVREVKSAYILEPGPLVLKGLEQIAAIILEDFST